MEVLLRIDAQCHRFGARCRQERPGSRGLCSIAGNQRLALLRSRIGLRPACLDSFAARCARASQKPIQNSQEPQESKTHSITLRRIGQQFLNMIPLAVGAITKLLVFS
jgi:hypothetical protein